MRARKSVRTLDPGPTHMRALPPLRLDACARAVEDRDLVVSQPPWPLLRKRIPSSARTSDGVITPALIA